MIGVPVAAVGVVGEHCVRPDLVEDADQRRHRAIVVRTARRRANKRSRMASGRRPGHAGVAERPDAAELPSVADAQRVACGPQLGQPVPTQLVGLLRGQSLELVADDLALLPERGRDQRDRDARRDRTPQGDGHGE